MSTTPSHTQGEFEILVQGTGSGRGPSIVVADDRFDGGIRELCHLETYELSRNERYIRDDVAGNHWEYDWYPNPMFNHDEVAANARLFAGSAKLLAATRKLLTSLSLPLTNKERAAFDEVMAVIHQIDTPFEFEVEEL